MAGAQLPSRLRFRTLLPWGVLIVAAHLVGRLVGAPEFLHANEFAAGVGMDWRATALVLLIVACALGGAGSAIGTIAGDHEEGWLLPYFAAGGRRRSYIVAVFATTTAEAVLIFGLAALLYAGVAAPGKGSVELLTSVLGAPGLIASVVAFAVAVSTMVPRRGHAVSAAISIAALPVLVVVAWTLVQDAYLGPAYRAALYVYLPPFRIDAPGLIWHLVYCTLALAVAVVLSRRFLARYA